MNELMQYTHAVDVIKQAIVNCYVSVTRFKLKKTSR